MGEQIQIGSTVRVRLKSGMTATFTISHPREAAPARGIISYESPLGKALLGRKEGDTVIYEVEDRTLAVDIIEIYLEPGT